MTLCAETDITHDRASPTGGTPVLPLHAGVPDARHVTWADAAHLPAMERPEDFAALVWHRAARG